MGAEHLELPIAGMTCASCANRVERKLNTLDGVTATVNYATERATVAYDAAAVEPEDLLAAVEAAGYTASLPAAGGRAGAGGRVGGAAAAPDHLLRAVAARAADGDDPAAAVRELAVALAHARRAGRGLGRAAVPSRRVGEPQARRRDDGHADLRRHARRVRLVAVRAVRPRGRHAGHAMGFELFPERDAAPARPDEIYLEVASAVTVFILAGATSRRGRSAARAPRSPRCWSSAPRTSRSSVTTAPSAACPSSRSRWPTASWSARARRSLLTASSCRAPPPSTSRC